MGVFKNRKQNPGRLASENHNFNSWCPDKDDVSQHFYIINQYPTPPPPPATQSPTLVSRTVRRLPPRVIGACIKYRTHQPRPPGRSHSLVPSVIPPTHTQRTPPLLTAQAIHTRSHTRDRVMKHQKTEVGEIHRQAQTLLTKESRCPFLPPSKTKQTPYTFLFKAVSCC